MSKTLVKIGGEGSKILNRFGKLERQKFAFDVIIYIKDYDKFTKQEINDRIINHYVERKDDEEIEITNLYHYAVETI